MQNCDTDKMYRKITNPNLLNSVLSLQSITGSDCSGNSDYGEAASSRGCASHYFKDSSSAQVHQYDSSGNSIVDNDTSPIDGGSSTKIL